MKENLLLLRENFTNRRHQYRKMCILINVIVNVIIWFSELCDIVNVIIWMSSYDILNRTIKIKPVDVKSGNYVE